MTNLYEDMEQLLAGAEAIINPRKGDLLQGYILAIDSGGLILDLGMKRDGIVPRTDLEKLLASDVQVQVGDKIAVMVVVPEDQDGNLVVSIAQARESQDWIKAQNYLDKETIFEAQASECNRGGLIVPFGRLHGFVPASHLTSLPRGLDIDDRLNELAKIVHQTLPLKVIEVDPQRRRLVFSERQAIRQWRQKQKADVIQSLQEGEVRTGEVTSLREFGAFIDIGGADGLVHISELAWHRVEDPAEIVKIGDTIDVQVIHLDRKANRIGLSIKRLLPNPWQMAAEQIEVGQKIDGAIARLTSAGVYVRLDDADGLEGLLALPQGLGGLTLGERISAKVVKFEPERERLELNLEE